MYRLHDQFRILVFGCQSLRQLNSLWLFCFLKLFLMGKNIIHASWANIKSYFTCTDARFFPTPEVIFSELIYIVFRPPQTPQILRSSLFYCFVLNHNVAQTWQVSGKQDVGGLMTKFRTSYLRYDNCTRHRVLSRNCPTPFPAPSLKGKYHGVFDLFC